MEETKSYARQMMKRIKEQQRSEKIDYFNVKNCIEDGYIIINYAKHELEETQLMNGRLRMVLPKFFTAMESTCICTKYPEEKRPQFVYTSEDTKINLTFSVEEGEVEEQEVENIKNLVKKEMLRVHSGCKLEEDEMLDTHGGKPIGVFSMEVPTFDGTIFHATFFRRVQQGLLLGTFSCDAFDKNEWKTVYKQCLATIEEIKEEMQQ